MSAATVRLKCCDSCLTAAADDDTDVISVGGADGAGAGYRVKFKHKIPIADVGECRSYGRLLCEAVLIIGNMCAAGMIVSRKVKWKKVELIANAALCPPGKKMDCPKWAQGKINFLFSS